MNTYADKTQEAKSLSVANHVAQKQGGEGSTFQFVDNRPEAVKQRKLQEMADNYSSQQQQPIQKKKNNTGLPDKLKSGIENLSGYSMDDVKVHYNSDKPAQLNAHAYAQGTNIHLASGQEENLPHEAWHVVQQKQGRVKSTTQMKAKININNDAELEKEADVMGRKAKLSSSNAIDTVQKTLNPASQPVQCLKIKNGVLVSTFDESKVINKTQSVISVRSSDKVFHGGHTRIYLEYLNGNGEGIAQQLDLWADGITGKISIELVIKQKEYNPSNFFTSTLFNREITEVEDETDRTPGPLVATGNYQAYAIKADGIQGALAKVAEIKSKADSDELTYGFTLNPLSNLNPFSSVTKMNCSEFSAEVLRAAGVNISSGLFGMPSTVSSKDTRTNDQIYKDSQ
ncbi:hypothetical protein BTA51_19210 [Hahella sp. CCB-MM4]|uniref:eCIS core domain-containing protein n=1 Tax=Hahella sp. (strain CCB-MM4) TaxID=1926491 RepID=UPI000B9B61C9|nr:DUF4157 domain-containing protein [Hahella sp. CCB-MM4]OZG71767.1 hypothetical protein BTA51_19210 [Hahella sp. CCB-MM4]